MTNPIPDTTLCERITELVVVHGSLRKMGTALEIDHAWLWRLQHDKGGEPSEELLKKLALRKKVVRYERI